MQKTRYSEKPEPLLIETVRGYTHITIATNIKQLEESDTPAWEADTNAFWTQTDAIDLEDVRNNPANYLNYASHLSSRRAEAKAKAQQAVDDLRNGCPITPVPSFREGAAVCNRASDKVMLLAGVQMRGLPMFELADGTITALTEEDLQGIMHDIAAWEMAVQSAKQECWGTIDNATTQEEIDAALGKLYVALG